MNFILEDWLGVIESDKGFLSKVITSYETWIYGYDAEKIQYLLILASYSYLSVQPIGFGIRFVFLQHTRLLKQFLAFQQFAKFNYIQYIMLLLENLKQK